MPGRLALALAVRTTLGLLLCVGATGSAWAQSASPPADDVPHLYSNVPEPGASAKSGPSPWQIQPIAIPEPPARIFSTPGLAVLAGIRIQGVSGAWYAIASCESGLCANPANDPQIAEPMPRDALPGSHMATGTGRIAKAWLTGAAQRLGDTAIGPLVAGTLVIQDRTTRTYELDLGLDAAFVDLRPRIVSFAGEDESKGDDAVFVVRADHQLGAALVAVTLEGEGLVEVAGQTPPAGHPGGWLNPVGSADFTGGGRNQLAVVVSPDAGGSLQILDYSNRVFRRRFDIPGVSNHIPGKPIQDLGVIADFDGSHVPGIAVPDAARKNIRILTFAGGKVGEPADIPLPSPVATDMAGVQGDAGKRPMLLMGLEDGELVLLR